MTLQNAIKIFNKKCPDLEPVGYWNDSPNIILATRPTRGADISEVCQYIVFQDGRVQGTNPLRSDVILETPMKKIY